MPSSADNVFLTFPPRPISQWERALLAEWFTATQRSGLDQVRAFVSERRGDDPRIAGRIVVYMRAAREPAFLVYSPSESSFWVVASPPDWTNLQRFRTLRAALNSILPVLEMPETSATPETADGFVF
jgi:hypothetical protein